MPYIKKQAKQGVLNSGPDNAGELNYFITNALIRYAHNHPGYQGINDVLGALEGAKLEFYRRYAAPYEDTKIVENGDVY